MMTETNPNAVFLALKHTTLMRMIERNQTMPESSIELIALDLMIALERHLRGIELDKNGSNDF